MHDGMLRDQRGRCEWDKPVCSGNIRKLQQRVVIFAVAVGRNQDGRRPAALACGAAFCTAGEGMRPPYTGTPNSTRSSGPKSMLSPRCVYGVISTSRGFEGNVFESMDTRRRVEPVGLKKILVTFRISMEKPPFRTIRDFFGCNICNKAGLQGRQGTSLWGRTTRYRQHRRRVQRKAYKPALRVCRGK